LKPEAAGEPIVVAITVESPELADRLVALLADLPGLRLAAPGELPDVALVTPPAPSGGADDAGLTPREREVLTLLAEGDSNKAIARRLAISINTVKFHVAALLDKLDAAGRTDAVAIAARRGVIHL
jgi:DNA-binding CsgD family transcriptional regulator